MNTILVFSNFAIDLSIVQSIQLYDNYHIRFYASGQKILSIPAENEMQAQEWYREFVSKWKEIKETQCLK